VKNSKADPGEINGFLDRNTSLKGELRFRDTMRVDGRLSGRVVSEKVLIVGDTAEVSADIEVGVIVVMGKVSGTVKARQRIEVHPGGRLEADVVTPRLDIADGAVFQGHCDMDAAKSAPSLAAVGEA
jgi:cytoskeletal protein CcmA (bactofilin family)